jgi:hypothetical protein
MVAEAYRLPVEAEEMNRIEHALREREKIWADRRMLAEQVARAGEAVGNRLRTLSDISNPQSPAAEPTPA